MRIGTGIFLAFLALSLGLQQSFAQSDLVPDPNAPIPPVEIPVQDSPLGLRSFQPDPAFPLPGGTSTQLPGDVTPYAPADALPGLEIPDLQKIKPQLALSAKLTEEGGPIRSGLVWRVFGANPRPDGILPLIANAAGGTATFDLEPGVYLVYCGFGFTGTTVRVEVSKGLKQEAVVLNAGGLKLTAAAEDRALPSDDVRFDVFSLEIDDRGERKMIAQDIKPGELVRLAANTYHVVSRYGTVNALTRADVEVKAGKLTEVTLFQRAAEVTLKLVGESGGEAIADTKWSVLTPGGDIVTEGVGAFPSFILAAGDYSVVAKHDDKVFQRQFEVETGRDAEVEVLAKN